MSDWPQSSQRTDDVEFDEERLFAKSGSPYWHDTEGKAVAWRDDNQEQSIYGPEGSVWNDHLEATSLPPKDWSTSQQKSIDELKQSIDIKQLLEKAGIEYTEHTGSKPRLRFCCPFHDDTKPSMDYWFEINAFKCWSCGAKGDSIEFYWRLTNNGVI